MEPVSIFLGATGLNTVSDEARLGYDDTGLCDLAQAVNISIDATNRPGRRVGYTLTQPGSFHSLFADEFDCYVGLDFPGDTSIMRVNHDGTVIGVRSGLRLGARISWAQDHDKPYGLFYANGFENGMIIDGISYPWPDHTGIVAPSSNIHLSTAPVGYMVAIVHGRMMVATNEALYYSEPFAFGCFNLGGNYLHHPVVRMIKPVDSGVFISTDKEVFFYRGKDIATAEVVVVSRYPALEGCVASDYVEGAEIGMSPGMCAVWSSPEGVCVGTSLGEFVNINKNKVIYPEDVTRGAAILRGYNFIHCMS